MVIFKIKPSNFLAISLLLISLKVFAQVKTTSLSINYSSFTTIDGYPQGIVTDLHQDKSGFLWIGTADGLFRYDGYEFKEYRADLEDKNTIPSNTITAVITDKTDDLWLGTESNGLSKLERKTGQFKHYYADVEDIGTIPDNNIRSLCLGPNGKIWAGTRSNGLFSLDVETDSIRHYLPLIDESNSLSSKTITSICNTKNGTLWVGTNQGINLIDPNTGKVEKPAKSNLSNPYIHTIYEDPNGIIWVGTDNGLNMWKPAARTFERIGAKELSNQEVKSISIGPDQRLWIGTAKGLNALDLETKEIEVFLKKEEFLSVDKVENLLLDQQNLLWIGTWGGPLNRVDYNKQLFQYWGADENDPNALSSGRIKSVFRTQDQILWVGTNYDGLNRIDLKTGVNQVFNTENGLSHNTVYCIWADEQGAWIGTSKGLNYYDAASGDIYQYTSLNSPLTNDLIWAVKKDQYGHLWIGTDDGLAVLKSYQAGSPLSLESFYHDPNNKNSLSVSSVRSLYVDHANNLWIGTSTGGLNYYDRQKAIFTHYTYSPDDPKGIPGDYIFFINEDHENNIWVGTSKGASRFNRQTQVFEHLTEKDGLPNNFVFSIFEDSANFLWMSTNRGLFRYEPSTQQYKIFEQTDGLQDNEFNQGAAFQDSLDGTLFFGGINGLNAVDPNTLQMNEFVPPVVFTDLEYYNQSSNGEVIKVDNFSGQEPLKLTYKENIIRIKFAALNFIQPEKNKYQYQLKGFSNQWFDLKNTHEVVFTDLDPKKYTLKVKAANNDGKWNDEAISLPLTITPPLSRTTLAYVLYVLLGILFLQVVYQFFLSRRLSIAENQQLQEMDQLKTKFFTNIAHDFKSPLTVILSTIKSLPPDNRTRILVERSGKSLLDLINQMLELRKLESNKLSLRLIQGDVIECIRHTFESFQEIGKEQNVKLHLISNEARLQMDFDEEKLSRIIANLLSNAIKYNKADGNVYLLVDQIKKETTDYLSIRVKDTGIGIAPEEIPQVFNRFYQINPAIVEGVKSGSGVGLALTKELVQFLGGTIQVKSKLGVGSEFTVFVPIYNIAPMTNLNSALSIENIGQIPANLASEMQSKASTNSSDKMRLLLIEDHQDIAEVLLQLLSPYYAVELARDGAAGIAIAQAQIPDIIISDVMMPKKDGYEVLKILKTDEKTLHIPIIMLTVKSGLDSRIEGLQKGADAYISKPFSNTELLVQVENLLANRIKLQHYYQQNLIDEQTNSNLIEEDPFVVRAKEILLENISDEGFRIPQLTRAMGVSRTQLHNKLKAITGQSTSHFINTIRLKKGREMLLQSDLTISEIAYEVGFRDPNYFSGLYKDFFSQTPTETRK